MIIMGAELEGGVSLIPARPANPMAAAIDKIMIINVAKVPDSVLVEIKMVIMIARNISGIKVVKSFSEASKNALFNMIIPEL